MSLSMLMCCSIYISMHINELRHPENKHSVAVCWRYFFRLFTVIYASIELLWKQLELFARKYSITSFVCWLILIWQDSSDQNLASCNAYIASEIPYNDFFYSNADCRIISYIDLFFIVYSMSLLSSPASYKLKHSLNHKNTARKK